MEVTFIVKKDGKRVTKSFSSPYLCRQFVNKLRHSKKCILVSYPQLN